MRKYTLLIALLISYSAIAQKNYIFNLTDIVFKESIIKSGPPVAIRFSANDWNVYIGYSNGSNFKLIKYSLDSTKIVFEHIYAFANAKEFSISPDDRNMMVGDNFSVVYCPNFQENPKTYVVPGASRTGVWLDKDRLLFGPTVFTLSTWTMDKYWISDGKSLASKYFSEHTLENHSFQLYFNDQTRDKFGNRQYGLFIQNIRDPESQKAIYIDYTREREPSAISFTSRVFAYYYEGNIHVVRPILEIPTYDLICFELHNPFGPSNEFHWKQNVKAVLEQRIGNREMITVFVYKPRRHPITNEVLGPSDIAKGEMQIARILGDNVICRITKNYIPNDPVKQEDFVGAVIGKWGKVNRPPPSMSWINGSSGYTDPRFLESYHNEIKFTQNSKLKTCTAD